MNHSNIIKIITYIVIITALIQCKDKNNENGICKEDPFFKNDVNMNRRSNFVYPPHVLPVIGKTTEEEIYWMYKEAEIPYSISSFKKPLTLKMKNKTITFDKFVEYIDYSSKIKKSQAPDGQITIDKKHYKYFNLYIFVYKETVVYYTMGHWVPDGKGWRPGKHHNGYSKELQDESFPGKDYMNCTYMVSRPDQRCVFLTSYTDEDCQKDLEESKPWK